MKSHDWRFLISNSKVNELSKNDKFHQHRKAQLYGIKTATFTSFRAWFVDLFIEMKLGGREYYTLKSSE